VATFETATAFLQVSIWTLIDMFLAFEFDAVRFWIRVSIALFCLILLPVWIVLPASGDLDSESASSSAEPLSGTKLIWAWSVGPENDVDRVVGQARQMGFNAVGWNNQEIVQACRNHGMKAFALISPLSLQRQGASPQVLAEGQQRLPGFDRNADEPQYPFQYGGEPVPGNREILHMNLACPLDPGVINYAVGEAMRFRRLGYDGICWDFIGYRNYRSCECHRCRKELAQRQATDNVTPEDFYLGLLTDLYSTLYEETKRSGPGLRIATHIYPVFLPEILYGHKVRVDYCAETVSWFFRPHWSFEKIRAYTRKTLNRHRAMPMIGFYGDKEFRRDRKGPERLKRELEILKQQGVQHLMMCELGHLLRDNAAMKAVQESLALPSQSP